MSLPAIDGEPFLLMFLDISKAHPHCKGSQRQVLQPMNVGYSRNAFMGYGMPTRVLSLPSKRASRLRTTSKE
eukprot:11724504-Karenia_brevis.AAC.1